MTKRAWYRCNLRKARALIEQGLTVRVENGVYMYRRPVKRSKGYFRRQKKAMSNQAREAGHENP